MSRRARFSSILQPLTTAQAGSENRGDREMRASRIAAFICTILCGLAVAGFAQVNVTTQHNDTMRTGQNLSETVLTPSDVNVDGFGKLFSHFVSGQVYAQPLYLSNVSIPNQGTHNVIYVATEEDQIYAFDADSNQGSDAKALWERSFTNPARGITPVPSSDEGCGDLTPWIGITGTPVIDPTTNTMYVVVSTKENGAYYQRLHALDVTTGQEKFGGPVSIRALRGPMVFNAQYEGQRAGLLLENGSVYIAWGSHCDITPYAGWLMAYSASTLQQQAVFPTNNNYNLGGIWMAGSGVAADTDGNIFVATGNGKFTGGQDFGDSILKLDPSGNTFAVADFFTPANQSYLASNDLDLGSGGVMLLPDQPGSHPYLLVQSGKEGTIYIVDRTNMGKYNANSNSNLQTLYYAVGGMWSMPAYWNGYVYVWGEFDVIKAYSLTDGLLSSSPTSEGSHGVIYPGATPSISANGSTNAIVWAIESDAYGTGAAVLHAYDATNLATELYNSNQNSTRDNPGIAVKFTVPTVANGKVYVAEQNEMSVYGLLSGGK